MDSSTITHARRKEYQRKWIARKRLRQKQSSRPVELVYDSSDDDVTNHPSISNKVWTWDMIDNHIIVSSDSEDEIEDISRQLELRVDLSNWSSDFNVTQNAVDELLKILRRAGHSDLPKTARTLKNTDRTVNLKIISGMEYIFLGVKQELLNILQLFPSAQTESVNELILSLNIDGVPLFKSRNKSCWHILCAIVNLKPLLVFPVALTFGGTKPDNLDFLKETICDLKDLIEKGLHVDDKIFIISIKNIICDAPAKVMVKGIKSYTGFYGCDKCSQKGVHLGRMTYQETENIQLRTDKTFRNETNPDHHHKISPFCELPIDMIYTFPADYMHQICLGVQKRCLLAWLRGKKEIRISSQQAK